MSFMIVELIQYFFLQIILNRVTSILKFFSSSNFSIHRFSLQKIDSRLSRTTHVSFTSRTTVGDDDDDSVRGEDLGVLMADLGVLGGGKLPEVMSSADVFNVFEEEEPGLDEVKGAFDVFDENRDGFIDAGELQRVVCVLGLGEKTGIEDCRRMIGAFDENADGRIDFDEFVKVMESSFC